METPICQKRAQIIPNSSSPLYFHVPIKPPNVTGDVLFFQQQLLLLRAALGLRGGPRSRAVGLDAGLAARHLSEQHLSFIAKDKNNTFQSAGRTTREHTIISNIFKYVIYFYIVEL